MKISIIIPSFNSSETIEQTLQSIFSQDYSNIEIIVIDGGSSDGVVDIIKKYNNKIAYWVSEKDGGIYDAMNKGIAVATGDVIGILNSDDFYTSSDILSLVANAFSNPTVLMSYGDIVFVKRNDPHKIVRKWISGYFNEKRISSGWIMPHPAVFIRRGLYEKFGVFRTDFKLAGDYELLLRFIKKHKIVPFYIPHIFVCMREGGASGKDLSRRILGWRELRRAWRVNNISSPRFFILRRVFSKLIQFF